ncbi:MAG: hypothetical protein ACI9P8_001669, partial [Bacteroidia bacterium]
PNPCLNPDNFSTTGIQANQATLNWNAMPDAIQYRVKYRPVGSSSWNFNIAPSNTFAATGLFQSTEYEWKVKTICLDNSPSTYGPAQLFSTGLGCTNPTGQSVTDIHQTGATMYWNSVANAIQYKLKIRPAGSSGWNYISHTDTFKVKNGLLPSTDYEWKVKTICNTGSPNSYGPAHFFTTAADPCPNPSTFSSDSITEDQATLNWNSVSNAISYKIKIRPSGTSSWAFNTVADPFKVKSGLISGTTYEWKVKSICTSGSPSGYGPLQTFSTLTVSNEMESKLSSSNTGFSLSYYPNPTNCELMIDLGGAFNDVSITIRNITGQVVYQRTYTEFSVEPFDLLGSPGIYTVEISGSNAQAEHFKVLKSE